jgi:hypothetical protein
MILNILPSLAINIDIGQAFVLSSSLTLYLLTSVRGHPSVSLLPLSSPTFYLCICIPPPHLCTISKDHTYSQRLLGPMVRRLPRSRLTDSRRLPASPSARTSTALDGLCKGNLTNLRRELHLSLAKGNPK